MATCRQRSNGTWEFTVKCKAVREKPFYFTFDEKEEGERYVSRIEALIRSGVVPPELLEEGRYIHIGDLIRAYTLKNSISREDRILLSNLVGRVGDVKLSAVNYQWAERLVSSMRLEYHLAPSTIRHYIGALARCFDWASNHNVPELLINPLRRLPRGYSIYTPADKAALAKDGKEGKVDIERDRRLEEGEHERILEVIAGKKAEGKQRALKLTYRPSILLLYYLALETAMRMQEIYTLTQGQVDIARRTVFLDKTKNGDKRQVPLSSVAIEKIAEYYALIEQGNPQMLGYQMPEERLFPWWDGTPPKSNNYKLTNRLSQQFARIFEAAECPDLHFHDLRHEATSRLFERTNLSDTQIAKITGHKTQKMLMRYANLRASSLADSLW